MKLNKTKFIFSEKENKNIFFKNCSYFLLTRQWSLACWTFFNHFLHSLLLIKNVIFYFNFCLIPFRIQLMSLSTFKTAYKKRKWCKRWFWSICVGKSILWSMMEKRKAKLLHEIPKTQRNMCNPISNAITPPKKAF